MLACKRTFWRLTGISWRQSIRPLVPMAAEFRSTAGSTLRSTESRPLETYSGS